MLLLLTGALRGVFKAMSLGSVGGHKRRVNRDSLVIAVDIIISGMFGVRQTDDRTTPKTKEHYHTGTMP